ncbi:DUF3789 domain-containing protein [Bacillus sp. REN16]|nr:DUF3789 domain-containing protein [Bacillus sp. REN16]
MLLFILGLTLGSIASVIIMSIMIVSKRADELSEEI